MSLLVFGPPDGTTSALRLLRRLLSGIPLVNRFNVRRHAPRYSRADGIPDVVKLVSAMPFNVYGMNGNPLGLRLTSIGHGTRGGAVDHIDFRYNTWPLHLEGRAGDERIVSIRQGPVVEYMNLDVEVLGSIEGLVGGSADFHRDWNLNEIERAPRHEVKANIDGADVVVELKSWQEPEQVTLAHVLLQDHSIRVVSLSLFEEDLLECLRTLAVLQENASALALHQQDCEQASREFERLREHLWG